MTVYYFTYMLSCLILLNPCPSSVLRHLRQWTGGGDLLEFRNKASPGGREAGREGGRERGRDRDKVGIRREDGRKRGNKKKHMKRFTIYYVFRYRLSHN